MSRSRPGARFPVHKATKKKRRSVARSRCRLARKFRAGSARPARKKTKKTQKNVKGEKNTKNFKGKETSKKTEGKREKGKKGKARAASLRVGSRRPCARTSAPLCLRKTRLVLSDSESAKAGPRSVDRAVSANPQVAFLINGILNGVPKRILNGILNGISHRSLYILFNGISTEFSTTFSRRGRARAATAVATSARCLGIPLDSAWEFRWSPFLNFF